MGGSSPNQTALSTQGSTVEGLDGRLDDAACSMSWASDLLGKCGLSYVVYQALYRAVLFFEIDALDGRNEFAALQLFCFGAAVFLSYLGARDVREEYKKVEAIGKSGGKETPARCYTRTAAASRICEVHFAYQIINLCISIKLEGLSQPEMIGHHVMAAALALEARRAGLFQWYSLYFLAVSEISTIPLCIMAWFEQFPRFLELHWAMRIIDTVSQFTFAGLFVFFRIFAWAYLSKDFWLDSIALIRQKRHHSLPAILMFQSVNVLLSVLQLYWLSLIVEGALKLGS